MLQKLLVGLGVIMMIAAFSLNVWATCRPFNCHNGACCIGTYTCTIDLGCFQNGHYLCNDTQGRCCAYATGICEDGRGCIDEFCCPSCPDAISC